MSQNLNLAGPTGGLWARARARARRLGLLPERCRAGNGRDAGRYRRGYPSIYHRQVHGATSTAESTRPARARRCGYPPGTVTQSHITVAVHGHGCHTGSFTGMYKGGYGTF